MKNHDITLAKSFLGKENRVLLIVKHGEVIFSSSKNGIQPFFDALDTRSKNEYLGCSIADKVIGKAALMLAAYLGAKGVYTPLASQHAVDAGQALTLDLKADAVVPYIINRQGDGMCPMEEAVLDIDEPEAAFIALKRRLET
ncbi:MAG: DUF1893 domain-containing protein [Candidatus Neomarinimicrobiota bacterium]